MIIKVCGMRETENIRQVAALGVDMMGLLPAQKTVRSVWECLWMKCHKALLPGCITTNSTSSSCTATSRR